MSTQVLVLGPLEDVASNAELFKGKSFGGTGDDTTTKTKTNTNSNTTTTNNCIFIVLRDAARAARNFDLVSKLRDFDALRRAIGVKIGAPLSCYALHRLADHLGIVIIIMHVTGHAYDDDAPASAARMEESSSDNDSSDDDDDVQMAPAPAPPRAPKKRGKRSRSPPAAPAAAPKLSPGKDLFKRKHAKMRRGRRRD